MADQRDLELEAQIAAAPDDAGLYAVYADWLTERGDPRGELITIELALETAPLDSRLRIRQAQLQSEHGAAWVQELRVSNRVKVVWRRGFIHRVELGDTRARWQARMPRHDELYAVLRRLPAAALVREIQFGHVDEQPSWDHCVAAITRHGVPASLRELAFTAGTVWPPESTSLVTLARAYPHLGGLAVLRIQLGDVDLGTIELPALRVLDVAAWPVTSRIITALARASWPRLDTLRLRMSRNRHDTACTVADVARLLTAELPSLRHLVIEHASFVDDLIPHLVPLALRLTSLGLGPLRDRGAQAILDRADAFAHLELDLGKSRVSRPLVTQLAAAVPRVRYGATTSNVIR